MVLRSNKPDGSYDPRKLGRALRRHRSAADLTQEELATRSGISNKKISRIEAGLIDDPGLQDVVLVADVLGLSPNAIATMAGLWRSTDTTQDWDDPRWEWLQSWLGRARRETRAEWLQAAYLIARGMDATDLGSAKDG